MKSEADFLRKLEARVRLLEAENKALRVALDNQEYTIREFIRCAILASFPRQIRRIE